MLKDASFPIGETKEEFEDAVDRLFAQAFPDRLFSEPQSVTPSYGWGIRDEWGLSEHEQLARGLIKGPGNHILACKRYPVRKLMKFDENGDLDESSPHNRLKVKWIRGYEQNQLLAHCCRHPENHDITAWFSCEDDFKKGIPDIYIFHCTGCGREHKIFCVGGNNPVTGEKDVRPFWKVH